MEHTPRRRRPHPAHRARLITGVASATAALTLTGSMALLAATTSQAAVSTTQVDTESDDGPVVATRATTAVTASTATATRAATVAHTISHGS
ncbi:MAG TPA: hypothetical protein VFA94_07955 [Acidimicrobiales bacterium]|nr:hypothetical protein [Acidimicrobiales bacterium]